MSDLQRYEFPATGHEFRAVITHGEPQFIAADACTVLGIGRPQDSVRYLDEDERGRCLVDTPSGQQEMLTITEAGLYSLILRSRKPEAKAFKRWVTHDVLPAIRKTGSYSVDVPRSLPEALRAYAAEVEAHEVTRHRVAELEPAAQAWGTLGTADGDYSVREAAQVLSRDPSIDVGQNRLFAFMREIGWIDATGQPYQAQVDTGRLVRRPISYDHPHTGEPVLKSQVRVTVKGVEALRGRLAGGGQTEISLDGGADL